MNDLSFIATMRRILAYFWYLWGLSWCYWGIRTTSRACFRNGIRSFDRALRLWPGFALAHYRRGLISGRELSDHRNAIASLTRAIALAPEWDAPYLQRGLFERFHGSQQAALADLRRYLDLATDVTWRAEAERQIAAIEDELRSGGLGACGPQ